MAITIPTDEELSAQVLAYLRTRFPGKATGTESFLGKMARATAMALLGLHKSVLDADNDSSPSQKTSSAALDNFAYLFGLSNGASGYGRKGAIAATGGVALCTGTDGTVYTDGLLLTASDGVTQVALSGTVTIPTSGIPTGSVSANFIGSTAGVVGNLPVDSVLTWNSPPAGSDSTVTLTTALSGGLEQESDADLLNRIYERLQTPPKGGTAPDYRAWNESISGISRCYVYPLRGGLGTVHTVLDTGSSGTDRQPADSVKTEADDYVETVRPVALQGYTSFKPYMPGNGMTVRLRMVPSASKYNFDWDDTATTYTVNTYTPGSPATLKLSAVAPATLKAAIDAAQGPPDTSQTTGPRLQIAITTTDGPVIPVLVRCVDYDNDVSNTTLTLQTTLPTGWIAPTAGDTIYAGGPMCNDIATAVLEYIDSLGPSRASGYADANDPWEDTAAIFRMAQIALDVTDTDNVTRFAKNILSGGVTLDGSATDVEATDDSTNGPELLYARWVLVTQ